MAISKRRVVLINVTSSPSLDRVKQQIRTIAAFGEGPRYLIHDNDRIFEQFREQQFGRCYRCHFDRSLFEVMGIKGFRFPTELRMRMLMWRDSAGRSARQCSTTSSS